MNKSNNRKNQFLELGILAVLGLMVFFLWNTPVVYPVKLFVVLTHEISHGLAVIISGGTVFAIEINEYLGGECLSKGGNELLIASSGYMGSLIFGSLLFLSAYNKRMAVWSCTIISVILLLFSANFLQGGLGITLSIIYTILLYLSPRYFNPVVNSYFLKILASISIIYVFIDIKEDLITDRLQLSDAQLIADATGLPALVWGLFWMFITSGAIFLLIRYGYNKGFKQVS
ncbi:MAG: hypothetical protein CVV23_11085 [Ignavibacteriae bacterium HGW-Ignavibacteriae-2]|jgi:hypothetical protein|nr:MAG: hypothetical protein CVV23_11085 [Ignavibacteriae bacterium HGW-Ignavibacteriae-2]